MSRLITKLKIGEEIIIDGIVRLHRPEGNDKLRLVIDSPIDLKIEKRIIPYDERIAKQKAQRK